MVASPLYRPSWSLCGHTHRPLEVVVTAVDGEDSIPGGAGNLSLGQRLLSALGQQAGP